MSFENHYNPQDTPVAFTCLVWFSTETYGSVEQYAELRVDKSWVESRPGHCVLVQGIKL